MNNYSSPQEIAGAMDKESILEQLKRFGINPHHATGIDKLAHKLFKEYEKAESSNNALDQPLGEDFLKPSPTNETSQPTISKKDEDKKYNARLENIAKGIRREAEDVLKSKPNRSKSYISNSFNFNLPRKGVSKKNKIIRFVDNYDSLDITEQRKTGEVFKLPNILFRGIEGPTMKMGAFEGRSLLSTENPVLQEFIETHTRYGADFILYDKEEISKIALIKDRKITKLKSWAYDASMDDLVCTLSYLSMRRGVDSYSSLAVTSDINSLRSNAASIIETDSDEFLGAMESREAKFIHLVHKAKDAGIIKISRDKRFVKLAENNKVVCESSLSTDWENDLVDHLTTPQGVPLLKRMEQRTGFFVV